MNQRRPEPAATRPAARPATPARIGPSPARPGLAGFSLLGLLVTILIIMLLYTTSGPGGRNMLQVTSDSRASAGALKAEIDAQQLATLVVQHHLQHDEYPAHAADLGIEHMTQYRDRWLTPIAFRVLENEHPKVLEVLSAGPDKEHGNDDDEVIGRVDLPL